MEFRPSSLAREWARTGPRDANRGGRAVARPRPRPGVCAARSRSSASTASTSSGTGLPSYDGNGARRAANIVTFATLLRARSGALAREFRPDIVVASSTHPLDIYGARSIARRSGARLVFEVHDLWPLTPIELGGVSPRNPFIVAMDRAERYACRHADLVVSILPAADDYLVTRGLDRARYVHIPNGISLGELEGDAEPLPAGARRADRLAARRGHLHRGIHRRHRHGQRARRPRQRAGARAGRARRGAGLGRRAGSRGTGGADRARGHRERPPARAHPEAGGGLGPRGVRRGLPRLEACSASTATA